MRGEDPVAMQIGFRRALTVGSGMWISFTLIDLASSHYLDAGPMRMFLAVRLVVIVILIPILVRMHRQPVPSERLLLSADLLAYSVAAIGIGIMCVEFRGLQSPYIPGVCLVLLSRTVTAQYAWRRGVVMTGVPLACFFLIVVGSALFSPQVAAQFHDAAALTTFAINVSYVLGTFLFLVVGGHVVWSLRRQIFEARSLGRYRLKRRLASGGMGDVWVAYHPGLKRDVAVKISAPTSRSAPRAPSRASSARCTPPPS